MEALGKDYGIKGIDGTGPWCFDSWTPRTEIVLKRHDAYKWGPSMYQNKGPVKFEKLSIKIVPEDASRVQGQVNEVERGRPRDKRHHSYSDVVGPGRASGHLRGLQ